jgi:hypothetical protein
VRDKKNYGYCSDGYEYGTHYSSCKNWKEILEVDQFRYIFDYEL